MDAIDDGFHLHFTGPLYLDNGTYAQLYLASKTIGGKYKRENLYPKKSKMVAKTIEGAFGVDWRQNDGSIWRSQLGMFGSSQQDKRRTKAKS